MDIGLLIVRIAAGVAMLGQARGKLGQERHAGAAAFFRTVGFEPAGPLAMLTALTELGVGLLLIAGLLTPLAVAGALGVLVNAIAVNAVNGWAASRAGAEYPVTLGLVIAALAFTGPGGVSVDAVIGWRDVPVAVAVAAIAAGSVAAAPLLAVRHRRLRRTGPRSTFVPDATAA